MASLLRPTCTLLALLPALPGQRFDELAGLGLPRNSIDVRAVALVDVDSDGDADLVVGIDAYFPGAPLQLWENVGFGRFVVGAAARMPNRSVVTAGIAVGDVDGDNDPDLLIAVQDGGLDLLFLNDGLGNFRDATAGALPALQTDSRAAALADLDGDGDLDAVIAVAGAPDLVLWNDGSGVFSRGPDLPTRAFDLPVGVLVADVDGQGRPEILVLESLSADRLWFFGATTGAYDDRAATWLPPGSVRSTAAAIVDVDADGDPDVVLGTAAGNPELLLLNDNHTRFVGAPLAAAGDTSAVVAADVDGDGDPDLLIGDRSGPDRLLLNDGAGSFSAAPANRWPSDPVPTKALAVADVDADGDVDVVVGEGVGLGRPGRLELLLNDGAAAFLTETGLAWSAPFADSTAIAVADLDGDDHPDVIAARVGGPVAVWFGARDGRLTQGPTSLGSAREIVRAIATGDVDGDGDPDVLLGVTGSSRLFRNDGAGVFTDVSATAFPLHAADTVDCALVDVDGDGDLDAYFVHAGPSVTFPQSDALWSNDGSGVFTDVSAARLPGPARLGASVDAGDVDGDGDVDLLIGNRSVLPRLYPAQPDVLLLNDGFGRFTEAPASRYPLDASATVRALLRDVDGDGDLDAVAVADGEPMRLLLNDGTGVFAPAPPTNLPPYPIPARWVEAVDADDDGDVDLVLAVPLINDWLLMNDGTGVFAGQPLDSLYGTTGTSLAYRAADFDGDGDQDLVLANGGGERDRLLFNLTRHIDLPYRPRPGRTFRIDIHATDLAGAGDALLWVGLQLAPRPILLPGFGALQLDPAQVFNGGMYPIGGNGDVQITLPLPNAPMSIGTPFHVQALVFPTGNPFAGRFTPARSEVIRL
ncbi:MAG: VCBS repeat-containing protein [Planctomycetes bacterium]|nr:VCBS repeat-containing protein [Planctomycetota bacterium]